MVRVMSEGAKKELFGKDKKRTEYIPKINMEVPSWLPF